MDENSALKQLGIDNVGTEGDGDDRRLDRAIPVQVARELESLLGGDVASWAPDHDDNGLASGLAWVYLRDPTP